MTNLATENLPQWSTILTSRRNLFEVRWRELWQYRDLVWLLVHRDITSQYKQTVLGPLWFLVQPLVTTLTYAFVFGRVAKISTDGTPHILFYMLGVVTWSYFADCFLKTSNTFVSNAQVFGKVYFPRMVVPLSTVLSSLLTFIVQFTCFLFLYFFFVVKGAEVQPNWRIIITPILTLQMAMLGLGVGCLISSLTTRFRDLSLAMRFGVQLWMFASTVVYPLSSIDPAHRIFFILNPMVPIIESFRFAFLGAGIIEIWHLALSLAVSILVLLAGVVMFNRVEHTVMDTI